MNMIGVKGYVTHPKEYLHGLEGIMFWRHAEDDLSDKTQFASQTSDGFLAKAKNAIDVLEAIKTSMWDHFQSFLTDDAFCQSWSGVPHKKGSKCLVPANLKCLSCIEKESGICALAGFAAPYIVPAILTAGSSLFAETEAAGAAAAAETVDFLAEASQEGKLVKILANVGKAMRLSTYTALDVCTSYTKYHLGCSCW